MIGAMVFSAVLAGLAVASVFFLDDPWSIVALVLLLAASFQLISRIRNALRSYVEVDDEGVRGVTANGQDVSMSWRDMTILGVAEDEKGFQSVFCYNDDADQYLQLPQLYEDFESLASRFSETQGAQHWTLSKGETIKSRLRAMVMSQEAETEEENTQKMDDAD